MPKTRGTGLLMVWADIDADFDQEQKLWYEEEHLPRSYKSPGFSAPAAIRH
jgi:hypothetical protein